MPQVAIESHIFQIKENYMKKFNQQNMATTELDFARQLMKNTNRKKV